MLEPSPLQPYFSTVYIPDLRSLNLSEDEQATISRLQMRMWRQRSWMLTTDAYYRGMQIISNLGIAIPPELNDLRILVGWPKVAVDPYVERLSIDSFRVSNSTKADETLSDMWISAGMEAEQSVAFLESLVMGRAYYTVGSGLEDGDPPCIGVESPLNMSVGWDARTRKPKEALQSYWMDSRRHAALYLPERDDPRRGERRTRSGRLSTGTSTISGWCRSFGRRTVRGRRIVTGRRRSPPS
jgi:hypothetical protein